MCKVIKMKWIDFFSKGQKVPAPKKATTAFTVVHSPLSEEGFRDLLLFTDEKEMKPRLPSLIGEKVLEISPRHKPLTSLFAKGGASLIVRLGGTREKEMARVPRMKEEIFILSHWESLPFLDHSFDCIVLRTAFLKGNVSRLLREASRVLKPEGLLILSDLHPFSLGVQQEHLKSPVGEESMGPGFERYFKFFRESGLALESVKEMFYDGSIKKFFESDSSKKNFESLRKTPLLIFFFLKMGK